MIKQLVFQGLSPASKWRGCLKSNRELWIYEKCRKNGQKSVFLEKSFELVLQTLTRQLMEIEEVLQGRQNAFPENPKKWPKNDKNWESSDSEFNLWLQTVTWELMYKSLFMDLIWRAYWKCDKRRQRKKIGKIGKKKFIWPKTAIFSTWNNHFMCSKTLLQNFSQKMISKYQRVTGRKCAGCFTY